MLNLLWRNVKWRFKNRFTIMITILQPMLWLVLYSVVADSTMKGTGIKNYTAFILPGVMFLVTFSACSSGGIMNFLMKNNGSFYRILISPVRRSSIVLAQMLEAILVSLLETFVLCVISLLFAVRFENGIAGILLIGVFIFLTAFFLSGAAYTISLCLPNEVLYETIMTAIVLPVFFLSSALFPADNLRGILKILVTVNPFTHVIDVLRGLIMGQSISVEGILPVILLFTGLCICSFLLAMWKMKRELVS